MAYEQAYPGMGLMGALDAGNNRRIRNSEHDDSLLNSALARMVQTDANNRENQKLPGTLEGLALGNQQTAQNMGIAGNKELDRQKEQANKDNEAMISSFPQVAEEMEKLPPGARLDYINSAFSSTEAGRRLTDTFKKGVMEGMIRPEDFPRALREMQRKHVEASPEYRKSMDVAKAQGDTRITSAEISADARVDAANRSAESRVAIANMSAAQRQAIEEMKATAKERAAALKHSRDLEKLERTYGLKAELAEKIEKAKQAGGEKGSKSLEEVAAKLMEEINRESRAAEPNMRVISILQEQYNRALQDKLAIKAEGAKQADPVLTTDDEGNVGIKQQPRSKPSGYGGGASGSWGKIERDD